MNKNPGESAEAAETQDATPPTLIDGIPLAVLLFVFWILLSGKFDAFHLAAGALSALATTWLTSRLFALNPPVGPPGRNPFAVFPWLRLTAYLPWLAVQIVVASFQVVRVILSPKLAIRPRIVRFKYPLPNNMARATLANSITLTPGTVTLDVREDEYVVHALMDESASGILSEDPDDMKQRVRQLYGGVGD